MDKPDMQFALDIPKILLFSESPLQCSGFATWWYPWSLFPCK